MELKKEIAEAVLAYSFDYKQFSLDLMQNKFLTSTKVLSDSTFYDRLSITCYSYLSTNTYMKNMFWQQDSSTSIVGCSKNNFGPTSGRYSH